MLLLFKVDIGFIFALRTRHFLKGLLIILQISELYGIHVFLLFFRSPIYYNGLVTALEIRYEQVPCCTSFVSQLNTYPKWQH